jgi:hypothetical protein
LPCFLVVLAAAREPTRRHYSKCPWIHRSVPSNSRIIFLGAVFVIFKV